MHLKVFLKLKNPKKSLFWVKKPKKTPKKQKKLKYPLGWVKKKTRVFSNPESKQTVKKKTGLIWKIGSFLLNGDPKKSPKRRVR
jgi:hypothetical protein